MSKTFIVTGGAGFIGSALIRSMITSTNNRIINIDSLTYAGNLESLSDVDTSKKYFFEHVDIRNKDEVNFVFKKYKPDGIYHLAAESHVDRSINNAADFISTNILGTYTLLEVTIDYLKYNKGIDFRFLHVSTDEVFGTLGDEGCFTEESPYAPRSPYAATKASSDHLVRAWYETYGLPVFLTNCSNNFGSYQFPEKLIPLCIHKALTGESIPVYGDGKNIRDWLYVDDHVSALQLVMERGNIGETYTVGGGNELANIDIVTRVCQILDELAPRPDRCSYTSQITFVSDRPGHDYRYAIDSSKLQLELGWKQKETFSDGLRKTVEWYLNNKLWVSRVMDGSYRSERLGIIK